MNKYEPLKVSKYRLYLFQILKLTRQAIYLTRNSDMNNDEDIEKMNQYLKDIILAVAAAIDLGDEKNV